MIMGGSIRKRTGNDINITINVKDDEGASVNLTEGRRFEVWLVKRFGRRIQMKEIGGTPETGVLNFVWKASEQSGCGEWSVLLRVFSVSDNEDTGNGMSLDRVQAVTLTEHTCQNTDSGNMVTIDFVI